MNTVLFCLVLISASVVGINGAPSPWDSTPLISQGKMAFLYIIGDGDEAEQTWSNFKNLTHLWENVKDIDNAIPGYGQVKSAIVALNGDKERALDIFATAQKSTFILGGFVLGGPLGALGGAVAADASTSVIFDKPVGLVEHAVHFKNKTSSEHIDAVLDLTLIAAGEQISKAPTKLAKTIRMKKVEIPRPASDFSVTSGSTSGMSDIIEMNNRKHFERQVSQTSTVKELILLDIEETRRLSKKNE